MNVYTTEERLEELYNLLDQLGHCNAPPESIEKALTLVSELKEEAHRDRIRAEWFIEECKEKERVRNEKGKTNGR